MWSGGEGTDCTELISAVAVVCKALLSAEDRISWIKELAAISHGSGFDDRCGLCTVQSSFYHTLLVLSNLTCDCGLKYCNIVSVYIPVIKLIVLLHFKSLHTKKKWKEFVYRKLTFALLSNGALHILRNSEDCPGLINCCLEFLFWLCCFCCVGWWRCAEAMPYNLHCLWKAAGMLWL